MKLRAKKSDFLLLNNAEVYMKKILVLLILLLSLLSLAAYCKSMAELNPEFENYIIAASRPKNDKQNAYKTYTKPFVLFHFSDCHGDGTELGRYLKFYDKYKKYFDDIIHTGDFCAGTSSDDYTYWKKNKAHKVLNVIGNHDAIRKNETDDWNDLLSDRELYEKFFAPYVKYWNVWCEEHTYYYKDYPNKKIRLIVINNMLKNEDDKAQFEWFEKTLKDAKEKDLSVLIGNHFAAYGGVPFKCNWNNTEWGSSAWFDLILKYEASVDKFMNDGGNFICWFGGDTHWDFIGYGVNYPKQLSICVDATNRLFCDYFSDVTRCDGTKSQDLANAMVVDTTTNTVKLIRIGANVTSYLKQRNTITIDYKKMEVVCEY